MSKDNNIIDLQQYRLSKEKTTKVTEIQIEKSMEAAREYTDIINANLELWLNQKDKEYQELMSRNVNESVEAYLATLDNTLDHFVSRFVGTKYEAAIMHFSDAFEELENSIKELDKE